MINKLFSMHNIKYIISVDDCFLERKREELEAAVYSEMCTSLVPFETILSSSSQATAVAEISEIMGLGFDTTALIRTLVNQLEIESLEKCYEICEENGTMYTEERDGIKAFIESLKSTGQINEFRLFSSTTEANLFDVRSAGMTDGAILWLLDRNFSRVGESPDAGLALAENIVQRSDDIDNYVYILSAVEADSQKSEDDIEKEFDSILSEKCSAETHSFIYYINKKRILTKKTDRIAKSLAQGFKRKACYELFQLFLDCLSDSLTDATTTIQSVRQKTLNSLFANRVQKNGESYTDFAGRFVQIFHYDEYNKAIAQKYDRIASKAKYYESLCSVISENAGNERELTAILKEYREIELYNHHINAQHCEVATGDIYNIDGSVYLLVSQSCDTVLRDDGHRKLEEATLLKIVDDTNQKKYSYPLSCFSGMTNPKVVYHSIKFFPFEILDLCTLNTSGQAMVSIKNASEFETELELFRDNYRLRFYNVLEMLSKIHNDRIVLQNYWDNPSSIPVVNALEAHARLDSINPNLKNYTTNDTTISFPVSRVCRLNELTTIDVINEYGTMLSRIGQPFDFAND